MPADELEADSGFAVHLHKRPGRAASTVSNFNSKISILLVHDVNSYKFRTQNKVYLKKKISD